MTARWEQELDFAVETSWIAGQFTLELFRLGTTTELKQDRTPVTEADRGAEEIIRTRIAERFPEDAVIGEEFGGSDGRESDHELPRRTWYIDPIDGTRSFVRGVPLYAVLIGLEVDGRIEVGVAHFPGIGETVAAARGLGCTLNGEPTEVCGTKKMRDGYVSFGDPGLFEGERQTAAWQRMMAETAYRVGWSDAYGHALVATGRLELMVDPKMNAWDCGPFPVILREAGGYFGDWSGNETIHGGEAVSTTRALLPQVLDLLAAPGESRADAR